jgi:predicted alpha/beta hydrolase family esterase
MPARRVLLLPGWGNSGPNHWQTHWERAKPEFVRVCQDEWTQPEASDWVCRLDAALTRSTDPAVMVAHSLGCALIARWALSHTGPVAAALLVAPVDVDAPSRPLGPRGFAPLPLMRLPFRSILVASDNDPYLTVPRGRQFAGAWGSEHVLLESRGHIGDAANLGMWEEGLALLAPLRMGID